MASCRRKLRTDSPPGTQWPAFVKNRPHGFLRPPDLIIQDELHLISGPLGSMVGSMKPRWMSCAPGKWTARRCAPRWWPLRPRSAAPPIRSRKLFVRKLEVFPPQGTSIRDSFFAIQRPTGAEYPGRRYLGISRLRPSLPGGDDPQLRRPYGRGSGALRQV